MLFHQLLRACLAPRKVSIVAVESLPNQGSDAVRSLTLTGHQPGDLLIAMTAARAATAPAALPTPWASILTVASTRGLRLSAKTATEVSEAIDWTGAYGYLLALRNASGIGAFNTQSGTSGTVQPIPALSGLDTSGKALILAGGWATSVTTAADAPFQLLYPPQTPTNACAVFAPENKASALSGKTFTWSATGSPASYAVEILG